MASRVFSIRNNLSLPEKCNSQYFSPLYTLKKKKKKKNQQHALLSLPCYLGKHGFSMLSDHGALITVHCDGWVVVWLFWVLENVIQVCYTSFKDSAKITRNEGPSNCCEENTKQNSANALGYKISNHLLTEHE